ncbi:MAG: hypothetical protein ACXV3F_00340 [Frankiaceae bacterium]
MATSGIDSTTGALVLAAMNGGTALSITGPLKLLWLSAVRTADNGTDTEVSTGSGYTAGTGFSGVTFAAATTGAAGASQVSNVAATITNMPACTWAGNRIVDSSGTPKTTFWAALAASKTVNAGDTVSVASGSLTTSLA